jgi:hypothetical protein
MTESEWLACAELELMVKFLADKVSQRKARLFACACCRRLWNSLWEERGAIQTSEDYADGLVEDRELQQAHLQAKEEADDWADSFAIYEGSTIKYVAEALAHATSKEEVWRTSLAIAEAAALDAISDLWRRASESGMLGYEPEHLRLQDEMEHVATAARKAEEFYQARLLRDIFGNPFRTVEIDPAHFAWRGGTIPRLAQAAYDERLLPGGRLDPVRLAILADALEEAGCTQPDLIEHLRSTGPHVRGCHVVDLLLAKG